MNYNEKYCSNMHDFFRVLDPPKLLVSHGLYLLLTNDIDYLSILMSGSSTNVNTCRSELIVFFRVT